MQQWETTAGLPAGWRQERTPTGRIYYLNDVTCTTQWERPGEPSRPIPTTSLHPPQQPSPHPPQREQPQSFSHHPQLAQAAKSKFPAVPIFDSSKKVAGAALAAAPPLPLAPPRPLPAQVKVKAEQKQAARSRFPAVPAFDSSEKVVRGALAAAPPLPLAQPVPPTAQVKTQKTEDDSYDDKPLAAALARLAPSRAAEDARSQIKHENRKEAHVIFVVDISASMKTRDGRNGSGKAISRMEAVQESCLNFVRTHLKQEATPGVQDLYSLVFFNGSAHVAVRRQLLSPAVLSDIQGAADGTTCRLGTNYSVGWERVEELVRESEDLSGQRHDNLYTVVFLSDGRPGDLNGKPPALHTGGGEVIRSCLSYRSHGVKYTSACAILTGVAKMLQQRLTVHTVGIGAEGMEWLQFLAKAATALGSSGVFSAPQHIAASISAHSRAAAPALAPHPVAPGIRLQSLAQPPATSTLGETFTSILSQHTLSSRAAASAPQRKVVIQYEDRHQWLQQGNRGSAAGGQSGEGGGETIYPANQMSLTRGGYVSWKDVGHVRMRDKPFASGGQRLAYHLFVINKDDKGKGVAPSHPATQNDTSVGCAGHRHLVGKESKFEEEYRHRLKFHTIDLALQDKASELAREFNRCLRRVLLLPPICPKFMTSGTGPALLSSGHPVPVQITMLSLEIYRLQDDKVKGGFRYISAEPHLEGSFVKYNGNNGYVAQSGAGQDVPCVVAQAFTHWTFEFTSKETDETLMVCDIQGIDYRYTDPSIISLAKRFGKADLGMQGYHLFFRNHKCNELCSKLGLERRDCNPASVPLTAKTPEALRCSESKTFRISEHVAGAALGEAGAIRASEAQAQGGSTADLSPARSVELQDAVSRLDPSKRRRALAAFLVNKVTVRKFFPKYGWFEGEIVKYDAARDLYSVFYEDGDSEEMEFEDLKRYLPKDLRLSCSGAPKAGPTWSSCSSSISENEPEPAKKKARHHPLPSGRDQGHFLMNRGDGAGAGGAGRARGGQGTGLSGGKEAMIGDGSDSEDDVLPMPASRRKKRSFNNLSESEDGDDDQRERAAAEESATGDAKIRHNMRKTEHVKKCGQEQVEEEQKEKDDDDDSEGDDLPLIYKKFKKLEQQEAETAAASNVQVKVEEVGEVEEYDGSYDCLICCESVRRMQALCCSQCTCNPFHQTCHKSWSQHAKVVPSTCPQCAQPTVVPFTRAR